MVKFQGLKQDKNDKEQLKVAIADEQTYFQTKLNDKIT